MDTQDRRYQRTHKLIKDELEKMLVEMEYSEITVSSLSERVNINRKTFYNHYDCLDDVLSEILEEFVGLTVAYIRTRLFSEGSPKIEGLITGFFRMLRDKEALHKRILCSPDCRRVWEKSVAMLTSENLALIDGHIKIDDFRTKATVLYLTQSIMPIYTEWLKSDRSMSDEELGDLLEHLMLYGAKDILPKVFSV